MRAEGLLLPYRLFVLASALVPPLLHDVNDANVTSVVSSTTLPPATCGNYYFDVSTPPPVFLTRGELHDPRGAGTWVFVLTVFR